MVRLALFLALFLAIASNVSAFGFNTARKSKQSPPLPTFDATTNRYTKSPSDDGTYPYDAIGSALRHGPSPLLTRLFNADEYEQGVLKYMYTARVGRAEATGNTDARLNNAVDWAYQKQAEKNGKPKVDYTVLKKKQAVLTIVWALGVTPLTISVLVETVTKFVNDPGPCSICN